MKRIFCLLAFLFLPVLAKAQNTTVTATVTDPNGEPYAFGSGYAALVCPGNQAPTYNGFTVPRTFTVGTFNGFGTFTQVVYDVSLLVPTGCGYQWHITAQDGVTSFITGLIFTVTGSAVNESVSISSYSVPLPGSSSKITYLDCSTFAGGDMGAKLNACFAAAPADGAVFDATRFPSPQTISTPVDMNKPGTITTCGLHITQTANILLDANGASWIGCANLNTVITKAANIDQITVGFTFNNVIQYLDLEGNKAGGFTGNGLRTDGPGGDTAFLVLDCLINGEANDGILDTSVVSFTSAKVYRTFIDNFGVSAINSNEGAWSFYASFMETDLGDETGSVVVGTNGATIGFDGSTVFGGATPAAPAVSISGTFGATNFSSFFSTNGYPAIQTSAGTNGAMNDGCFVVGGGANGAAMSLSSSNIKISDSTISGNNADAIYTPNGSGVDIENSTISIHASVAGIAGIHIVQGAQGTIISGNKIQWDSASSSPGLAYGIWFQTNNLGNVFENKIEHNIITSNKPNSIGIFWDNTAGQTTGLNFNSFSYNECALINSGCIKRTDATTAPRQLWYENVTDGASALFVGTGSVNDVVIEHHNAGVNFATLPVATNGSEIFCIDCTNATPTAGSGSGAMLFRFNGVWSGGAVNSTGGITGTTYATSTNCAANGTAASPSVVSCGSAAAGMFSCATNASTGLCQINTTAVTLNSEILIITDQSDGGAAQLNVTCNTTLTTPAAKPLLVSKSPGTAFTINLGTVSVNPACFEFHIIN